MKWALIGLMAGAVPPPLADYHSWTPLTPSARLVPYELAVQCIAVTDAQLEQLRKSHGPHTNRWVRVYANPLALEALKTKSDFPPGAVIAKEKLSRPEGGAPEGVAFMIKHGNGAFAKSGGWEFRYYPSAGKTASVDRCAACHRAGAAKDYVFSSLQ